jgi:riboflavin biosynthesis pyrimidine reductase
MEKTSSDMLRPWISCNLAISADGKISSAGHRPATWTSPLDHQRLLALRQPAHALMVGRGTLETDQMTLTVPGNTAQPLRCIVSRHGNISPEHPIFHRPGGEIHLLITDAPHPQVAIPATIHHESLADFLLKLHTEHQVEHLHCEGGGQLIRSLAELDAIDEFHLTLAGHTLLGGAQSPTVTGIPDIFLPKSQAYALSHFEPIPETGECFLSYRRVMSSPLSQ